MKAKEASLIAKILSTCVLIGGLIAKCFGIQLDIMDVILVALTIFGIFGTVDLNIAIDKIVQLKQIKVEK